jgi:methionine-rich copper-binding protein CopC
MTGYLVERQKATARKLWLLCLLMLAVSIGAIRIEGHAILKSSSPAIGGTVNGPDVPITLMFNVRVDAKRSKLELLLPGASTVDLPIGKQSAANSLVSKASGLKPGAYTIRWQVLAPDGHISRGEIPFTVKNA